MPNLSTITTNGLTYDIKDASARADLALIKNCTQVDFKTALINLLYPVGSIYISMNNTAPFTVGTWTKIADGRALIGVDSNKTAIDAAGKTIGQADAIVPQHVHPNVSVGASTIYTTTNGNHTHAVYYSTFEESGSGTTHNQVKNSGSACWAGYAGDHYHAVTIPGHSHSFSNPTNSEPVTDKNYQPSFAVYIWKRTA